MADSSSKDVVYYSESADTHADAPKAPPEVPLKAPSAVGDHTGTRDKNPAGTSGAQNVKYMTEPEEARERLKASIDALTQQASLQVQLQKEPVKMLGGASAVGAVLGLVIGRQFRKTKTVYVDAASPVKHQKGLVKAQQKQQQNVGGALAATLGTLAFKTLMDRVISPKLEEVAQGLLEKAGQPQTAGGSAPQVRVTPAVSAPARPAVPAPAAPKARAKAPSAPVPMPAAAPAMAASATASPASAAPLSTAPLSTGGVASFVKPTHPGVVALPQSRVEAKAQGTPIAEDEKANPNVR